MGERHRKQVKEKIQTNEEPVVMEGKMHQQMAKAEDCVGIPDNVIEVTKAMMITGN